MDCAELGIALVLPSPTFPSWRSPLASWFGFLGLRHRLSLLWAPVWQQGIWDLWQLAILAACFCLGDLDDLPKLYKGLAIGIGINTLLAIGQHFGWQPVHHNNSDYPAGFFFNPDMLGESAALVSIALYSIRSYWPIALTLPAVFLSGGRAAILSIVVVILLEGWKRSRVVTALLALAILTTAYLDNHKTSSFNERIALWEDTASGLTSLWPRPRLLLHALPQIRPSHRHNVHSP